MSRTSEKARAALTAAQRDVDSWTAATASADAEVAAAHNSEAETPADLDRVGENASRATARAEAARRALAASLARRDDARFAVLQAALEDEVAAGRAARKTANAHENKVRALLDQLERLDGVPYVPDSPEPDGLVALGTWGARHPANNLTIDTRTGDRLLDTATHHELRAAVIRYVVAERRLPVYAGDLDIRVDGLEFYVVLDPTLVPEAARDYLAA